MGLKISELSTCYLPLYEQFHVHIDVDEVFLSCRILYNFFLLVILYEDEN